MIDQRPVRRVVASPHAPSTYDVWPATVPAVEQLLRRSWDESFLQLLGSRFDSPGLYCLDEPEAALSFSGQIALIGTLHGEGRSRSVTPRRRTG